jgi:hypothetical protein
MQFSSHALLMRSSDSADKIAAGMVVFCQKGLLRNPAGRAVAIYEILIKVLPSFNSGKVK